MSPLIEFGCRFRFSVMIFVGGFFGLVCADTHAQESAAPDNSPAVSKQEAISVGVQRLLEVQHEDGALALRGRLPGARKNSRWLPNWRNGDQL